MGHKQISEQPYSISGNRAPEVILAAVIGFLSFPSAIQRIGVDSCLLEHHVFPTEVEEKEERGLITHRNCSLK